jgi:pimeloyl-ACP methyl ester carboxylesterase
VLIHGFGASRAITWKNTGWYQTLARAGRRIVAIDCRGHGESGKPHDIPAYDEGLMADDIVAVLEELDIGQADIMGYSMGGYLTIRLMHDRPERAHRAVLAGIGATYFRQMRERAEIIAQGLLAKDPTTITDPVARSFATFASVPETISSRWRPASAVRAAPFRPVSLDGWPMICSWCAANWTRFRGRPNPWRSRSQMAAPSSCPAAIITRRWATQSIRTRLWTS